MNLLTAFEISFKSIATNKIRSILTTLSIIIGVAVITGIFFGYYPALQASKMDPIQALRYE